MSENPGVYQVLCRDEVVADNLIRQLRQRDDKRQLQLVRHRRRTIFYVHTFVQLKAPRQLLRPAPNNK